ncbi:hypothetical protein PMZ80_005988 [Knufia obscura]|uniref:Uncharacterized protein n=1 Tax=Knufia obscura TaxID=1635080 RepID=A0ABR0RP18_9EURO|nr:hypothetical protein PMZ80_005988 [Knufia obscura]
MVSTFTILAIVLLAIPVATSVAVLISATSKRARASRQRYAAKVHTQMMQASLEIQRMQGPNGRTVFRTTTTRPAQSKPQRPPRTPVLPYNIQQAYKEPSARKPSLKNAWQRLSRPFSMGPQQYAEDQIELTQKTPPMPAMPHKTKKGSYEGPVSPLTAGSISSWNTVDRLDHNSDPISPLSVTNMNGSSSVTGTILRGYQSQRQKPSPISHNKHAQDTFQNIPLTPPTRSNSRKLDLGTSRGFIPPHVDIHNKQQLKEYAMQKGKEVGKQAVVAGANYAANNIKANVVDANRQKVNHVQLAKPPKAKTVKGRGGWI